MFLSLPRRLAKALPRLSEGQADAQWRKIAVTQEALGGIIMSRERTNKQPAIRNGPSGYAFAAAKY